MFKIVTGTKQTWTKHHNTNKEGREEREDGNGVKMGRVGRGDKLERGLGRVDERRVYLWIGLMKNSILGSC